MSTQSIDTTATVPVVSKFDMDVDTRVAAKFAAKACNDRKRLIESIQYSRKHVYEYYKASVGVVCVSVFYAFFLGAAIAIAKAPKHAYANAIMIPCLLVPLFTSALGSYIARAYHFKMGKVTEAFPLRLENLRREESKSDRESDVKWGEGGDPYADAKGLEERDMMESTLKEARKTMLKAKIAIMASVSIAGVCYAVGIYTFCISHSSG